VTLEDIFGTSFQSAGSASFSINQSQTKQEFGCLVSVLENVTIDSGLNLPQAKIIAKVATPERMGNFIGLGRPVAETPYTT